MFNGRVKGFLRDMLVLGLRGSIIQIATHTRFGATGCLTRRLFWVTQLRTLQCREAAYQRPKAALK